METRPVKFGIRLVLNVKSGMSLNPKFVRVSERKITLPKIPDEFRTNISDLD